MKKIVLVLGLITVFSFAKENIVVFHAGSLSVPFAEIEKVFESKYPQYDVKENQLEVEHVLEKLQTLVSRLMLWLVLIIK